MVETGQTVLASLVLTLLAIPDEAFSRSQVALAGAAPNGALVGAGGTGGDVVRFGQRVVSLGPGQDHPDAF